MRRTLAHASCLISAFSLLTLALAPSALAQININIVPPAPYQGLNNITPQGLVSKAISLFLGAAGVIAFIYLLWGGVNWVMAGGDKDALDKARKKIVQALIGLAVVFSSYALVRIITILFFGQGPGAINLVINQIQ